MNLLLIKDLCEQREGGLTKLAQEIGMSVQNLHRCVRVNQIQAHQLELIASLLGVSIISFFDDNNMGNIIKSKVKQNNDVMDSNEKEIEHLKALLEEKERLIQVLLKDKS